MNCAQTLNNLPHLAQLENAETRDQSPDGISRRTLLAHLRTCPECQMEYEALWNTASLLESLEEPIPPPELVGNIQQQIRCIHKRQQVALFANPLAWCLDRLKLDFAPRFVNATALLFYLIASCFFVKLAFLTDSQEPELGLTAMEKSRLQQVRISPKPWALLKNTTRAPEVEQGVRDTSQAEGIQPHSSINDFFNATLNSREMWSARAAGTIKGTVDTTFASYSSGTASEKLTTFWSDIKTKL